MIKYSKIIFLVLLCLLTMCTACSAEASASRPDTLQVTRFIGGSRSWAITDAAQVQQIFAEEQQLPVYKPNSRFGPGPACASRYTLSFEAGNRVLEKDELESGFCSYMIFADGSEHQTTTAFESHLAALLHLTAQQLHQI